jgi:hypothetical protein
MPESRGPPLKRHPFRTLTTQERRRAVSKLCADTPFLLYATADVRRRGHPVPNVLLPKLVRPGRVSDEDYASPYRRAYFSHSCSRGGARRP